MSFTFHNVSINTENPDVSGVDFQNFTFHDVSINTEMKKEWSTALDGRVCKECQALEGAQISMDDSFETQSGRRNVTVLLPPLHPRCKCAVKYVEATYEIV